MREETPSSLPSSLTSSPEDNGKDYGRDEVDRIVEAVGRGADAAIPICQALQAHFGYLPEAALRRVCEITSVTPAALVGVATFYNQFRTTPSGRHVIRVCVGTACHVKGSERVRAALARHLGLGPGEDTDARRLFTLQRVACLGCCTLAPVVQIDRVTYGHMSPAGVSAMIEDFLARERVGETGPEDGCRRTGESGEGEIRIGLGSCCMAGGSARVYRALSEAAAERGAGARVKRVGCVGMCHRTPVVEVVIPGREAVLYERVGEDQARAIVRRHFRARGWGRRLRLATAHALDCAFTDEAWRPIARAGVDPRDPELTAFLGRQRRVITEDSGAADPTDLDEYRRRGGFTALARCIGEGSPQRVIEEILRSGLRGRGGAGFETGRKWAAVRAAVGDAKYLICNGDEGDPGAFMDRMILESYPYRVIEGMLIGAFAVGAGEAIFYIRSEYPLALRRVREALDRCEAAGLLNQVRRSRPGVTFAVTEGAGAFVCGEETALIASLEGGRGMPRVRPQYPAERGLWGRPTLINNCETFAAVPWILRNGAEAFAAMGVGRSKGTKVFSLTGKVLRGGLVEVPMGITVREIVEAIGGGVAGGGRFKAVQIGGPSGGCIPAELADTPVDYETLTGLGAMMGSGGFVVMDESDCMLDIARYFLAFTQDQSCGKCAFCRVGTRRMLDILDRICAGQGEGRDIDELERLARQVKMGSLCGLGRTAPNPILTTLRYFRAEYEAHLRGRCPAGKCKALIHYVVTEDCIGCTLCAQNCPADAIAVRAYERHAIDDAKCTRCDMCRQVCPAKAVRVE
jgi:NADH-quinone oxidoreductase subunit F